MGEWPAELDVDYLLSQGWRPTPFQEFVVKVASRCNLACDYCYVYTKADQSWAAQPRFMAPGTVEQLGRRIGEHAREHDLRYVRLVLHGGEPLLAGSERIGAVVAATRRSIPRDVTLDVRLQSNGVLLDEKVLATLREHQIRVGFSLDGDEAAHDRHRRGRNGHGTYGRTARAIRLLHVSGNHHLFGGLLCTVDLANDPLAVYETLIGFRPPTVDFLLPHGNWETPPPGSVPHGDRTPYGDWLVTIFDRWYDAPAQETSVRLFEEAMHLMLGGRSRSESLGLSPVAFVVIDTDGGIKQADTLKSAFAGAASTGLDIFEHPFDVALRHPSIAARQIGVMALADDCLRCDMLRVCGGGNYTHRYRSGAGFRSRSVYCADMKRLLSHISRRVRTDVLRISHRQRQSAS